MTPEQIAAIAKGLTVVQKQALEYAPNDTEWIGRGNLGRFKRSFAAMDRADLGKPQLCEVRCDVTGIYDARLTEDGLALRAYLMERGV